MLLQLLQLRAASDECATHQLSEQRSALLGFTRFGYAQGWKFGRQIGRDELINRFGLSQPPQFLRAKLAQGYAHR